MNAPLKGIRVLDAATFLAAPFCGTILADFGADVIKIEQPGVGDSMRRFGTPSACDDTLVWLSEARNKRSVTLDLRKPQGAALFRELAATADVVLENFRPGTLRKWGIDYETLSAANPKLVMLSVSAYGQTGPYKDRPGFARIAHAFSGLAYLAGEPGRPPVVPGSSSLADYISGLFGAIGVLIALRYAEQTGQGQQVDVALYESIFRLLDELAPSYAATGFERERMGPDTVNVVPHSHYRTSDGVWIALACTNDRMWRRLAIAMGRVELGDDERYALQRERVARRDEVNALVAEWVSNHSVAEVQQICDREEVPCSKLLSISEIFADPHYAARGNLVRFEDERAGEIVLPGAVPRMSLTPPALRTAGPALGAANEEIFGGILGLSPDKIASLRDLGVI